MRLTEKDIPALRHMLDSMFTDLAFTDHDHKYVWTHHDGTRQTLTSTTTLIGRFHDHFDEGKWAPIKAETYRCDPEDVKAWWGVYNEFASHSGGLVHDVNEEFYNRIIAGDTPDYWSLHREAKFSAQIARLREIEEQAAEYEWLVSRVNKEREEKGRPLTLITPFREKSLGRQFMDFYTETRDYLVPVKMETVIGNPWLLDGGGLGGMLDCIFWDRRVGLPVIYDYKTNRNFKEIASGSRYRMNGPLAHLPDVDEAHYTLQMSIYQYVLSMALHARGVAIQFAPTQLIRLSEVNPTYMLHQVPYSRKEVMDMLY